MKIFEGTIVGLTWGFSGAEITVAAPSGTPKKTPLICQHRSVVILDQRDFEALCKKARVDPSCYGGTPEREE